MSNFSDIQQVLNVRLAALSGIPKWKRENLDLNPDENEIFITSSLLPAETRFPNVGLSGFRVESGTFAILVKAVRYTGWGQYSNLVDDILQHFPRNLILTSDPDSGETEIKVHILKSYALSGYEDAQGRYTIPVHVRFDTYVSI
jgi:hypothetical protein